MRDKMTTRLHLAVRDVADAQETVARDVADAQETAARDVAKAIMEERQYHYQKACATRKKHAKQIGLDRRDFAVVVKNLKRTSTCNSKKSAIVIRNQASMIKCLETKVSLAELSLEFMQNQLQKEHKEAITDLVIGHRGSIRDLKYCHVTNLAKEKKKLHQQLCIEHQRHNSLYNEVLDSRHDTRSSVLQVVASIICGMYGSEQLKYFNQER
jgi:bisphosphoglycerate-dependent phosphoglycerate mutase